MLEFESLDDNSGGHPQRSMKSVAVVGAGVSGLVAAYSLKSQGLNVTLFESEHRAGGKIKTNLHNGILWEEGANTMTEGDAGVRKLIDDLGLRGQEQFFPKKRKNKGEQRVSSGKTNHPNASFSFHGGLQVLTDKLCKELGSDSMKLHSKVLSLSFNPDEGFPNNSWSISYNSHPTEDKLPPLEQTFDAVIMTAPLCNVQQMQIRKMGRLFLLDFIPKVDYVPLSVIVTTYKKENVKWPLEGFGVLIPSKEQENGLRTLGTIFSSLMFPDRAPSDQYLYTTFVGGTRNRDLKAASLIELQGAVSSDLKLLLGVDGPPTSLNHVYWKNAFPLYGHSYSQVLQAIGTMEENLPGFFYAGNHRVGLSVGKAISSGFRAAELVVSYFNSMETSNHGKQVSDKGNLMD